MIVVDRAEFFFPNAALAFLRLAGATLDWTGVATLCGPSGSGKTTLFRVLTGWYNENGGSCWFQGGVTSFADIRFVGTHPSLVPWLTVADNLQLHLPSLRSSSVGDLLQQVALDSSVGGLYPYQLSLGMYKRVELVAAAEQEPQLLLLDEFFSSVGDEQKEIVSIYLKRRIGNRMALITAHERELRQWIGGEEFFLVKSEGCIVGVSKKS